MVTGSTAYGEPEEGDDCDVFAITRPGTMWAFLTFLYLRLQLTRHREVGEPAVWCFNYVLETEAASKAFARPQGFLFAREALTARPVAGARFYRGLLGSASWLKEEAPRLFARWEGEGMPEPESLTPASLPVRMINLALYPVVAAYLQLVGLYRNHTLRRAGRHEECFSTRTQRNRLMVLSERYSRLTLVYAPAAAVRPVSQEA